MFAASVALERSREAMAVIAHHGLRCIAGITFCSAMFAVLKIPQRTISVIIRANPWLRTHR